MEWTTEIKDWYQSEYPTDEMGGEIREGVTFLGLFAAMLLHKDIYEEMRVADSVIRERVFYDGLAVLLSRSGGIRRPTAIEMVYKIWIGK